MAEVIDIGALKPGMVITQITNQNGPVKIRKSGLVTSEDMVRGLAEMGVLEVEIDPAQQVEIDVPTPSHLTQTQQLLQGDYRRQQDVDHSLSDQFNRSLFLPSVESLPSPWKMYAKQGAIAALLIVGGGAIGWTLGTTDNWAPSLTEQTYVVVGPNLTPEPVVESEPQVAQAPTGGNANTAYAPEPQQLTIPAQPMSDPSLQARNSESTSTESTSTESTIERDQPIMVGAPPSESGVVLDPQEGEANVISADLLAKFNQAVEELDSQARTEEPASFSTQNRQPDVPRIDQLPARTMTRLPSMSFSAHMYASNPQNRWVSVNGQRLTEGDWVDREVQLIRIDPQHVILSFQGQRFSMAALTDW